MAIENWLDLSETYLFFTRKLPQGETIIQRREMLVGFLKGIDFRFSKPVQKIVADLLKQGLAVTQAQLANDRALIQWVDDFLFLDDRERQEMIKAIRKGALKKMGLDCSEAEWLRIVSEMQTAIREAKQKLEPIPKPVPAAPPTIPQPAPRGDAAPIVPQTMAPAPGQPLPAIHARLIQLEEENKRLQRQAKLFELKVGQGEMSREIGLLNKEIWRLQQETETIAEQAKRKMDAECSHLRQEIAQLRKALLRLGSVELSASLLEDLWLVLYDLPAKSKLLQTMKGTAIDLVERMMDIDTKRPKVSAPGETEEDQDPTDEEDGFRYPRSFIAYTGFVVRFQKTFRERMKGLAMPQRDMVEAALELFGSSPRSSRLRMELADPKHRFPDQAKITWFDEKVGLVWKIHRNEKKFAFHGIMFP